MGKGVSARALRVFGSEGKECAEQISRAARRQEALMERGLQTLGLGQ